MRARSIGAGGLVLALTLLAGGCETTGPRITNNPEGRSYDGLYAVENVSVGRAWARADLDLSGYSRIMLEGAGVQFRPLKASGGGRTSTRAASGTAFPLNDAQAARLKEVVGGAFREELGRSTRFVLTDAAGPDVLLVRGALLDVVSRVPPQSAGRSEIFLDSVGEATLLIELVDSESGAVLVRALDRRAAERGGRPILANSVNSWNEVRRLATDWAQRLRSGLDSLDERLTIE
ncbi:MAG: DUF3313 family protein [Pseudomonadales bacterium]|jgi:hypothetical protein|nr:DUF3313 family protein [Pseudomonadales bacterium]